MSEGIRRLDGVFRQITVTAPAGNVTWTIYNGLTGRVERTVTNFVDGVYDSGQPDLDIITAYKYDNNGNVPRTILLAAKLIEHELAGINGVEPLIH